MPGHGLLMRFPEFLTVEHDWRWSGAHYQRTALDWLDNFDANRAAIDAILAEVYGADANLWRRRWLLALALAIFPGIDSLALVPVHVYSQTEYAAFVRLNALSASALVALLGLILSGLVRD